MWLCQAVKKAFVLRTDGTLDVVDVSGGGIETGTFTCNGKNASMTISIGTLTGTWSDDGKSIYCNELQVTASIGDTSIVADDDYFYIYKEDLGGYEVKAIDKTKAEYGAIKTGINGVDTVKLGDFMFVNNNNIVVAPMITDSIIQIGNHAFSACEKLRSITIPNSITLIGGKVFSMSTKLNSVIYEGTIAQWDAIAKDDEWDWNCYATYVQCSDGQVAL